MNPIEIFPLKGIGEVVEGDDVGGIIADAAARVGPALMDGDVLVVTQKIVSKAEGMAVACQDDAGRLELALKESVRVLRRRGEMVITETRHGFVCANSGVDASNAPEGIALLLPEDPDASAERIRASILEETGCSTAVIVSDTFGRPWRLGLTDVAIGVAGIAPIVDLRGTLDASGREMFATEIAVADELAGAAELVMGKADGIPVAVVRGYTGPRRQGKATELIRPASEDLFR